MVRVSEARRGRRRAWDVWDGRAAEECARGRRRVCLSLLSVVCWDTWSSAQRAVRPERSTLDDATFIACGPSSWPHPLIGVKVSILGLPLLLTSRFPSSPVLSELAGGRRHRCTTTSSGGALVLAHHRRLSRVSARRDSSGPYHGRSAQARRSRYAATCLRPLRVGEPDSAQRTCTDTDGVNTIQGLCPGERIAS